MIVKLTQKLEIQAILPNLAKEVELALAATGVAYFYEINSLFLSGLVLAFVISPLRALVFYRRALSDQQKKKPG